MRVPLQEISGGGDGDDDTGAHVTSRRAAHGFDDRLCASPGEFGQEVAPPAKQRPQQTRNREHDVTVGDGSEQLLAQPFGPEQLLLLLAGRAGAAPAAGECRGIGMTAFRGSPQVTRRSTALRILEVLESWIDGPGPGARPGVVWRRLPRRGA